MLLISHRGNLHGEKKEENSPFLLDKVIKMGYNIEVDVWKISNDIFLGHDQPQYRVDGNYLKNDKLWCHAKNLDALEWLLENKITCFWHQEDNFTLTSNGLIWTYPGLEVTAKSIIVCKTLEETKKYFEKDIYGICSDYVGDLV